MTDDDRERSFLAERIAARKTRRPPEETDEERPVVWFTDELRKRRTKSVRRLFRTDDPHDAA